MGEEKDVAQVTKVHPDSKGRVTLGRLAKGVSSFRVTADAQGRVLLEPFVEVPARELWLWENRDALESVRRGLEDARAGRVASLAARPGRRAQARSRRTR